MPDISMCANNECPHKGECYRYTAVPDPYAQSYTNFEPNEYGECEHKLPIYK